MMQLPWFAGSAQQLATEHQQPTYIVTRLEAPDEPGAPPTTDDVILFASELTSDDATHILWGFQP